MATRCARASRRAGLTLSIVFLPGVFLPGLAFAADPTCREITAQVVALDQAFYNNRLGALQAGGMIFALKRDVVSTTGPSDPLKPGSVMLRPGKRPRPLVLRMNVGDCLKISFTNLLGPAPTANFNGLPSPPAQVPLPPNANQVQPATRWAGVHVMGMEPRGSILSDGSRVGANASGLVPPGGSTTYEFYASAEGAHLLYSTGADVGLQWGFGGQLTHGLFGSVMAEPAGAEWYRSQVTATDLARATTGTTPDGHPLVNYAAKFANGTPILAMLNDSMEIVHSDLTAIITGPNHGLFIGSGPDFDTNPAYPDRRQPYREFAIHYHDDQVVAQAFPEFTAGGQITYTLSAGRDMFAINYGIGGIGAEVWANRLKVGPTAACDTCKFEEFFLSSWAVGDPAMVVDLPANAAALKKGAKATKALFPDDPSNVYHSYLGDHVKFRIIHAGTNITHVHHQHAHQWLHTENSDDSDYRDSQMISPGSAYTLDITYRGGGNVNQTVGDSIFHCHFYPHFAQGMWSLWRVHDVFEGGTTLDANGRPVNDWNRALPDGEIALGTPIPALVPLPTKAMAPLPARVRLCPVSGPADYVRFSGNACPPPDPSETTVTGFKALVNQVDLDAGQDPGFPFFVPGVAGKRPPQPPLDFGWEEIDDENGGNGTPKLDAMGNKQYLDGGLPRHMALKDRGPLCVGQVPTAGAPCLYEKHNIWDFSKDNAKLVSVEVAEEGTNVEQKAMAFFEQRKHPSFTPEGVAQDYLTNGLKRVPGAPFANPGIDLDGNAVPDSAVRRYKAADIQIDAVFNKKGWHFPQQRLLTLWGDVKDTLDGDRRPEPLFFRANSKEVVEYWLTNLVPNYYELDDFQVRTPTDILGQHIHLVKFDVTSSDGAANGFNYEDGTLSLDETREQIAAINTNGGLWSTDGSSQRILAAKEIPFFKKQFPGKFVGAQATVQRWYADPLLNKKGDDRTLRTVFTHDHFGPSTHQQAGLYAGLLIEPQCSQWRDATNGTPFGSRFDGGPTSWQAVIVPQGGSNCPNEVPPAYREFALEFQDRQLAYFAASPSTAVPYTPYKTLQPPATPWGWAAPAFPVKPPLPPNPTPLTPFPRLITMTMAEGTYSLNYSNEPLGFRVANPGGATPDQTDLGQVFRSIPRADSALNVQPVKGSPIAPMSGFTFAPPFPGAGPTDPYTPLLRAYPGDLVQVRTLVGAHMAPHSFNLQGLRWLFEPSDTNSGYRNTQGNGISEHYELNFRIPVTQAASQADYLYSPSSAVTGLENGNWGILRAYTNPQTDVQPVPGSTEKPPATCPTGPPQRHFNVAAVYARDVLDGPLVYNARGAAGTPGQFQIVDWNGLMYVRLEDLDASGKLKKNVPREPLVLRAAAGDCIEITLSNRIPVAQLNVGSPDPVTTTHLRTSLNAGLRPQLVTYDVTKDDGVSVGLNPIQTIAPGQSKTVQWYAGIVTAPSGSVVRTPVEFGAIGLTPADPLMQHPYGLLGALVIEPKGSTWVEDANRRASATVTPADGKKFREFVTIFQDDVAALRFTDATSLAAMVSAGSPQPCPAGAAVCWSQNGTPLANNSSITLSPGDSLVFSVKSGFHGITFLDKDQAQATLDFTGFEQSFKDQPGIGPKAWGTDGASAGTSIATLLAALQVRPTTAANQNITSLQFECTIHKVNMAGTLQIQRTGTLPGLSLPTFPDWTRAINYRTEPLSYRFQFANWLSGNSPIGITRALSDSLVLADPQTPVYAAPAGMPVRFRMVHPAGNAEETAVLHGHTWQEEPYQNDSREIGDNPKSLSQGSRDAFGPNASFDIVLPSAGGAFAVPGDYLIRTFIGVDFEFGMWSLFRVGPALPAGSSGQDVVTVTRFEPVGTGRFTVNGVNTVNTLSGLMAQRVTVFSGEGTTGTTLGDAPVDPLSGTWSLQVAAASVPAKVTVVSDQGGSAVSGAVANAQVTNLSTPRDRILDPKTPDYGTKCLQWDACSSIKDFRPAENKEPGSGDAPPKATPRPKTP